MDGFLRFWRDVQRVHGMGLCLSSLPTHHDVTTVKVSITTHTTHTSHTVVALFSEEGTKWYEIVYPVKVSKSSRVLAKKEDGAPKSY